MFKIIIDHRENDLKKSFPVSDTIEYQNLPIGDIKVIYDNQLFLLIERKTLPDLMASIGDGRYREQKLRIKSQNIPSHRVLYLLEGDILSIAGNSKVYYGMIINTMMRDKFHVFRTLTTEETIHFISRLETKLLKDPKKILGDLYQNQNSDPTSNQNNKQTNPNSLEQQYLETIKLKKKDNMTPRLCSILQLSQIPGCSRKVATLIIDKYQTLAKIIENANQIEDIKEKIKIISELKIPLENNKERKIGGVLGKRILDYLGCLEII